jgi:N-acetyltransferase
MDIKPVTLQGSVVRLEPLTEGHVSQLAVAGRDEAIWQFMRYGQITTEPGMRLWVRELLEAQAQGTDLPFAVIHLESGAAIGSTRYLEIRQAHRALEIGGTWYALAFQRTGVNTECKYLLLRHAFEELGCLRVQLKTDLRNERSQRAIERIGAVKEGVLRKHMILPDGVIRDSVYYSIIDSEWPRVKARLEEMIGSHG